MLTINVPLRVSRDRVVVYGAALFLAGLWQLIRITLQDRSLADWSDFWTAGATVGTRALLDPRLHFAFESAHGFKKGIWPYLPAFAWIFVPASHLSLIGSYAVNVIIMFGCAALAGALLADVFDMPRWFGLVAALAWPPVKVAALGGQNTPLALLIIALAIWAARRQLPLLIGVAIGLLLYKPSVAAPFILVLLIRREWRGLTAVVACAAAWYLLSVPAAGGSWVWPANYAESIAAYFRADFLSNAPNAVSLPGLLIRAGVPSAAAACVGIAASALYVPRLMRMCIIRALSITALLAVLVSLHAWYYEPVVILPALFYAMHSIKLPYMTWLVIAAYVLADISIFQIPGLQWNVLILVVLVFSAVVLFAPYQPFKLKTQLASVALRSATTVRERYRARRLRGGSRAIDGG